VAVGMCCGIKPDDEEPNGAAAHWLLYFAINAEA
jgi:hypothetical protein